MSRRVALAALLLLGAGCIETSSAEPVECSELHRCPDGGTCLGGRCARCGDGRKEGTESCDEGATNGTATSTCGSGCERPSCGDGERTLGEDCDDGVANLADVATGVGCPGSTCVQHCGDGITTGDEACDAGPRNGSPDTDCTLLCAAGRCGDGSVDPGESCDLGLANDDRLAACTTRCEPPVCGDGFLQPELGESCDGGPGCGAGCVRDETRCVAVQVATGDAVSLVVTSDGRLFGVGQNSCGQIGDPAACLGQPVAQASLPHPAELFPGLRVQYVDGGWRSGGGLTTDGRIFVFGHDGNGLHARGVTSVGDELPVLGYTIVDPASRYLWFELGASTALALREDGRIVGWGLDGMGQLGTLPRGAPIAGCWGGRCVLTPFPLFDGQPEESWRFRRVAAGNYHVLAIRDDGTVWGWGRGTEGQLGPGSTAESFNDCATLLADGGYYVDPTVVDRVPVRIDGPWATPVDVVGGRYGSFVLDANGEVWSFGANCQGEIGRPSFVTEPDPTPRPLGLGAVASIAAGSLAHTRVVLRDGRVWGFGRNGDHQASATFDSEQVIPSPEETLEVSAFAAAAGDGHTLVLDLLGGVRAIGSDRGDALGDADPDVDGWRVIDVCPGP